jgi:hypothetical protein
VRGVSAHGDFVRAATLIAKNGAGQSILFPDPIGGFIHWMP